MNKAYELSRYWQVIYISKGARKPERLLAFHERVGSRDLCEGASTHSYHHPAPPTLASFTYRNLTRLNWPVAASQKATPYSPVAGVSYTWLAQHCTARRTTSHHAMYIPLRS